MVIYATNKKAYFDYEIIETLEAGIILKGYEVTSIRKGKINLFGSYATFHNNELFLTNASIATYQPKNQPANYDARRPRKLLLKRKELEYLQSQNRQKGISIIPLKVYDKNGKIKIELALARGKKKYDKRESIKQKEFKRRVKNITYRL